LSQAGNVFFLCAFAGDIAVQALSRQRRYAFAAPTDPEKQIETWQPLRALREIFQVCFVSARVIALIKRRILPASQGHQPMLDWLAPKPTALRLARAVDMSASELVRSAVN